MEDNSLASEDTVVHSKTLPIHLINNDGVRDSYTSDLFARTWQEALRQCREGLNDADYQTVLKYKDAETLVYDLKVMQEDAAGRSWLSRIMLDIFPMLDVFKDLSNFFFIAMQSLVSSGELTMIWGFLYLVLVLSLKSHSRWSQISSILKKTRRTLERCRISAKQLVGREEPKHALLEVFIALILFWAETSKYMREVPVNDPDISYSRFIDSRFESTREDMEEAIRNLQLYATVAVPEKTSDQGSHPTLQRREYTSHQLYQIPYNNQDRFVGREEILTSIDVTLRPLDDVSLEQRCFSIWGMGGVGKSSIALVYANRNISHFAAIFWIRAETEASLKQSFLDLCLSLEIEGVSRASPPDEVRDSFHTWLIKFGKPWLIIFDNVEKISLVKAWWPSSPGAILTTTRWSNVAWAARGSPHTKIQVPLLLEKEANILFSSVLHFTDSESPNLVSDQIDVDTEQEATNALLERLSGLPLGINQVASLIKSKRTTVAKFLQRYDKQAGDVGRIAGKTGHEFDQEYDYALDTVWQLAFEDLQQETNPDAYDLLGVIAFMAPDKIPEEMFLQEDLDGIFGFIGDEDRFTEAKEELIAKSLIDSHDEEISIHRLVQTAFLLYQDVEHRQRSFDSSVVLLYHEFPKRAVGKGDALFSRWPQCQKYIQHCLSIAERFKIFINLPNLVVTTHPDLRLLLYSCGWFGLESASLNQGLEAIRIAKLSSQAKGDWMYSELLVFEGVILFELDKLVLCRESHEEALRIRFTFHGREEDPEEESNMGNLELAEDEYEKALNYFREFERLDEKLKIGVAAAYGYAGLSRTLLALNQYDEARLYIDKAYNILLKDLGPGSDNHIHLAIFTIDKGNIANKKGSLQEAMTLYQEALRRALLASFSGIRTSVCYYKIARVSYALDDIEIAAQNFKEAMTVAIRLRNDAHIARIAYRQALILEKSTDPAERLRSVELIMLARALRIKLGQEGVSVHEDDPDDKAFDRLCCYWLR